MAVPGRLWRLVSSGNHGMVGSGSIQKRRDKPVQPHLHLHRRCHRYLRRLLPTQMHSLLARAPTSTVNEVMGAYEEKQ
jgi:hypothetical protein